VRVPRPHLCFEGVLLMELVVDANGHAAPRLNDVALTEAMALEFHATLLEQVVRMLAAGVVHGDLSEFNILVGADGPVIIDLPQAVDAAGNNDARPMLERDVANLAAYFGQFAPQLHGTRYGTEIWNHYQAGTLRPGMMLTGRVAEDRRPVDVAGVLREVEAAQAEEEARLRMLQDTTG
jgi:RIO kinase 1